MIVHCPSCSTGYHVALPPPSAVLRCSRCREVVPPPAHRRRYVLATPTASPVPPARVEAPVLARTPEPLPWAPAPAPVPSGLIPVAAPSSPEMQALDAALFAPAPAPIRVGAPRVSARRAETEPAGASALVPIGLAALGAAAAWFAAPRLAAWIPPLPFAVEPWMLAAAGASCGLLLGAVWLGWRAGRR